MLRELGGIARSTAPRQVARARAENATDDPHGTRDERRIGQVGDADGLAGQVIFPTRVGFPGALREDVVDAKLGMPRDLDGDGVIDTANHAGNYRLLPVIVRVRWRGATGNASAELRTMLGNY